MRWVQLSHIDWTTVAQVAGAGAGAATMAVALPKVRAALRPVGRALAYLDPMRGLKRDVAMVVKEMRPNGGSSLTDKVNATLVQLGGIHDRQVVVSAYLTMLLDESPSLFWRSDINGRQVWASKALVDASGRPASELLGMGWVNVIHGADQARVRGHWNACIAEERIFEADCRFATPHGRFFRGRLVAKPFTFDGRVVGWLGTATIDGEIDG